MSLRGLKGLEGVDRFWKGQENICVISGYEICIPIRNWNCIHRAQGGKRPVWDHRRPIQDHGSQTEENSGNQTVEIGVNHSSILF